MTSRKLIEDFERHVLLLELIGAGMSEQDANIALDLHADITAPRTRKVTPIYSIGSNEPVDWVPCLGD